MVKDKIGIIGLGYVGLPLAVEFGKKISTVGFDINKNRINELNKGIDKTLEVTKKDLSKAELLHFSSNVNNIKSCNIFIITVPTPINKNNTPNLKFIKNASELIGSILKKGNIVIYESTVYPGCTENICVPILEKESRLK